MRGTLSPVHGLPGEAGLQLAARPDLRAASSLSPPGPGADQLQPDQPTQAPWRKGSPTASALSTVTAPPTRERWPHDYLTRLASGSP